MKFFWCIFPTQTLICTEVCLEPSLSYFCPKHFKGTFLVTFLWNNWKDHTIHLKNLAFEIPGTLVLYFCTIQSMGLKETIRLIWFLWVFPNHATINTALTSETHAVVSVLQFFSFQWGRFLLISLSFYSVCCLQIRKIPFEVCRSWLWILRQSFNFLRIKMAPKMCTSDCFESRL